MGFEEMVVALVASVGGIFLIGFVFAKITSLIRSWINRNNSAYDGEDFNRLAKAFMQHKKDTERRLQNLETIASGEEPVKSPGGKKKRIEESKRGIEVDEEEQEKPDRDNNNLRNMLRE